MTTTELIRPLSLVPRATGLAVRHNGHECVARLRFDERCTDQSLRNEIVVEIASHFELAERAARRLTDDEVVAWGKRHGLVAGDLRTIIEDARSL